MKPPLEQLPKSEKILSADDDNPEGLDNVEQGNEDIDAETEDEKIKHDWMVAAAVLDRLCSFAFAYIFFGGTFIFVILFIFHP